MRERLDFKRPDFRLAWLMETVPEVELEEQAERENGERGQTNP